jgi:dihydropteroate synthase
VPLVARLVAEGVVVSVDTWKAPVAEAALDAGATILNDVSGLRDERSSPTRAPRATVPTSS